MRTLTCLFVILILSSCKKDETQNRITRSYLNESLKEHFSFNESSYWIYQNQSMNIDSVVVSNYKTGFTTVCQLDFCNEEEYIKLTFKNVTQGTSYNHYLLSNYIKYNGGGDWGQYGQPIFLLEGDEGYEFNGLVVSQKFDSLFVLNKMYYEVEKMSIEADMQYQNEFQFNRDFYFVPSVGIIRTVIHDTTNGAIIWDLKNYNIE